MKFRAFVIAATVYLVAISAVSTAFAAPSAQSGQCPGATTIGNTPTSDGSIVLPADLTVCIHAGNGNTGTFVTDGTSTLAEYIEASGLVNNGGQVPGVSNYVIYEGGQPSIPPTSSSPSPSLTNYSPSPTATDTPGTSPSSPTTGWSIPPCRPPVLTGHSTEKSCSTPMPPQPTSPPLGSFSVTPPPTDSSSAGSSDASRNDNVVAAALVSVIAVCSYLIVTSAMWRRR